MDIRYLPGIDHNRLLAPYFPEGKLVFLLKLKIIPIGKIQGWTVILAGHYLSALSYMYAATGNKGDQGASGLYDK